MPNDDTPARRTRSPAGHGLVSDSSRTVPADQSTWVVGRSAWRVRGIESWDSDSTIFMTPATPAAAWVWPMLDFTDPSHSGLRGSRAEP